MTITFLHIGQTGIRIGDRIWQILMAENGINIEGDVVHGAERKADRLYPVDNIFKENSNGELLPAALWFDFDPTIVSTSATAQIYGKHGTFQEYAIFGYEDSSGNYAKARQGDNEKVMDKIYDKVRWEMEQHATRPSWITTRSASGGTGAGLTNNIMDYLGHYFPKSQSLDVQIAPSNDITSSPHEVMNYVLSTAKDVDSYQGIYPLQNTMLYRFLSANYAPQTISYALMNQVVGQITSHLIPVEKLVCNPVKGNHTRFFTTALYPRCNAQRPSGVSSLHRPFLEERFKTTFHTIARQHNKNFFIDVDPGYRVEMGLVVRGTATNLDEIERCCHHYDSTSGIMNSTWFAHHNIVPERPPQYNIDFDTISTLKMESHTGVTKLFIKQLEIFSRIFNKNYFVHYLTQYGMEIEEMKDAFETVTQICESYHKARPQLAPGYELERVYDNLPVLTTFKSY